MSILSIDEEKEQITFDNLQILDLIESGSIIKEAVCAINIYSPQKKIITIKMSQFNNSSRNSIQISHKSKTEKSQKNKQNAEEINEIKYNIFLALTKNCIPAYNEFRGVIENRYLKGKRLIIQDIEIPEFEACFKPKKFIFIPRKNMPEFVTDNGTVIFEQKNLKLNGKDLIPANDFSIDDIINEKIHACSKTNEDSSNIFMSNISSNLDSNEKNKIIERINDTNTSKKNEIMTNKSMLSVSSSIKDSSRINNSSEKEGDSGFVFYKEIDKYKKYTKYSYYEDFEKEVDGIYILHDEIELIYGKKGLQFDNNNIFQYILDNYNIKNSLFASIIIKNFDEATIPKNVPFFLEVKAAFDLSSILRQIKKISKFVHNMKNYNVKLPEYCIGILCSFDRNYIERQFANINTKYNGSNINDIKEGVSSYKHILRIIEENGIKFVIAAIANNQINGYNLGLKDFEVDKSYRKVELEYLYKKIKGVEIIPEQDLKKINKIQADFSNVYSSINEELKCELTYNDMMKKEKMIESLINKNKILTEKIDSLENSILELSLQMKELMKKNKKENKEENKSEKNGEEKKEEKRVKKRKKPKK